MPRPKRQRDTARARQLRRDMTLHEALLWNLLRKNPDDIHFRRQHPVEGYVLDFYCASAGIGIEVDGIAHGMGDRPERDAQRDAKLAALGIQVVRIPAADVLKSPEDVAEGIVRLCKR